MMDENFKYIYLKYRGFSVNVACKIVKDITVAEDISQEVFSHLYEIRHSLNFSNEKMMKSLIFTATSNKTKDYLKRPWRKREEYLLNDDRFAAVSDESANPETIIIREEERRYRKLVLDKLRREKPVNYDILIKTKYFGISPDSVAEEYGITRNNVNNRNLRTKIWMRKELEKMQKKPL